MPTLYRVHEPPEPACGRAPGRAARVARRADAAAAGAGLSPTQAADAGRRDQPLVDQHVRRVGHGRRGADVARAALAQAGALLAAQPRPRRARADPLLPLHLADPPLSRSDLPPRAAVRDRRGRAAAAGSALEEAGRLDLGSRARRDGDRARRRRRRALLPARARALRARPRNGLRRRGRRPDRRRRVRRVRRRLRGHVPVRRLRGDWWELNEEGTILRGERTAARSASATRCGSASSASTRRAGAST